jgi:TonB family protein
VLLAPNYRNFDPPWEVDPQESRRLRRYVGVALALFLFLGITVPLLHLPEPKVAAENVIPERLARIMVEEKPKPPPPPPKPVEEKPKLEPKPTEQPKPVDPTVKAREKAEKSMRQFKDAFADLRQTLNNEPVTQAKNLTGAVGQDSKAERSLIAAKAGSGSAGIVSTNSSHGFGSGAGSLAGHEGVSVNSRVAAIGTPGNATRSGVSGKAARSQEEIELVFDRNKGAIYALYSRALRERPELQGKMVLEFTIAPSGEVTACRVVSSELQDAELERKIVARVKLIRFESKDVETMTTTKPIEFFPS